MMENSAFLVIGAIAALIWANLDYAGYEHFVELDLLRASHLDEVVEDTTGIDVVEEEADTHAEDVDHSPEAGASDQADTAIDADAPAAGESGESPDQATTEDDPTDAGAPPGDETADAEPAITDDEHADTEHAEDEHAEAGHDEEAEGGHGEGEDGEHGGHHSVTTVRFIVNDLLMAFFFAIAAKEVWEALLPRGPLSDKRKAAMPLLATLGGMVVPAGVFLLGCALTGNLEELGRGWAVPAATDIAFCYMVARLIFGPGHPAIPFLLLLAIVDDAAGLVILAVFYPQKAGGIDFTWLLLAVAAVGIGMTFARLKLHSFWWYLLIPGSMCWYAFYQAGIHPALGFVPIIPTMPHAQTDLGLFARKEWGRDDTLNEFEHWWKNPVEVILGLLGLVNAGVLFSHLGTPTWIVLAGLVLGKPLGIAGFVLVGQKLFGLSLPERMTFRDVLVVGMVAGIGLTVALFVSDAAFRGRDVLDSVKMGALFSAVAAPLAFVLAKMLRIEKIADSNGNGATAVPEEVS